MMEEPPRYESKNLLQTQQDFINHCEAEIRRLKLAVEFEQQKSKELEEINIQAIITAQENLQLKKELSELQEKYGKLEKEILEVDQLRLEKVDLLREIQKLGKRKAEENEEDEEAFVLLEDETQKILSMETRETGGSRKSKNMLFNLKVQMEILNIPPFEINAILDTGATTCCIDEKAVPKLALEENPYVVYFSGITSKTTANKKLRGGKMTIGNNSFFLSRGRSLERIF